MNGGCVGGDGCKYCRRHSSSLCGGIKMLKYSKQPYNLWSLTAMGLPASQFSHLSHGNAVAQLSGASGEQIH